MKAKLFNKQSSKHKEVELNFEGKNIVLNIDDETHTFALNEVQFSERLGNMPRSIYLSKTEVCEVQDNALIDTELNKRGLLKGSRFIHHLESKSIYILPALAVTILMVFSFLKYVLPYSAEKIAYAVPQSIASQIGTGTLQTLDKLILKPSQLDRNKKQEIIAEFKQMATHMHGLPPLQLVFRSAKKVGANAFALPDGTIVMTDQLVILADNNKEILSVLAHEIGHIKNRHAIRMVLQNSAMLVLITTLTGDATSASSIVSVLPTMLIESSFSRDLESEADDYAMQVMDESGIALHYFADIMQKLSAGRDEDETGEYFSSHPITSSRIKKFQN